MHVNFFDTAIAYQSGTSEQYLGRAIRDFAKRDDVVIATKFLPRTDSSWKRVLPDSGMWRECWIEASKNLGMDYVDLYICHMWDYNTPLYDIMEGLNNAVRAGKVRYIGISTASPISLHRRTRLPNGKALQSSYRCRDTTT